MLKTASIKNNTTIRKAIKQAIEMLEFSNLEVVIFLDILLRAISSNRVMILGQNWNY